MQSVDITSHDITSLPCLLSASVSDGQPLPPYLKAPGPYNLRERMEAVDPELLSVRRGAEPCYAAFVVLQVASSLISDELQKLVR